MITKSKAVEAAMGELKKTEAVTFDRAVEDLKQGAETAKASVEHVQADVKVGLDKVLKTGEKVTEFGKGNLEAVMKSGQILTSGLTEMSRLMVENARTGFEEAMSVFKAATSVTSVKEAIELQSNFARTRMEKVVSQSGQLTEHSLKIAEQAFAPISARVNAAVETFS